LTYKVYSPVNDWKKRTSSKCCSAIYLSFFYDSFIILFSLQDRWSLQKEKQQFFKPLFFFSLPKKVIEGSMFITNLISAPSYLDFLHHYLFWRYGYFIISDKSKCHTVNMNMILLVRGILIKITYTAWFYGRSHMQNNKTAITSK